MLELLDSALCLEFHRSKAKRPNLPDKRKQSEKKTIELATKSQHWTTMNTFQDHVFRQKVDSALLTVRTILDTTKHPQRMAGTSSGSAI